MPAVRVHDASPDDDLFAYLARTGGDDVRRAQLIGAANAFKEGDAALGLAAADMSSRTAARRLLAATAVGRLAAAPLFRDGLHDALAAALDPRAAAHVSTWSLGQLKTFVLTADEAEVNQLLPGLASDVVACLVKIMSDAELVALGARLFHPLPGSRLGARGYLGARIQPNSPTDHPDDIRWQVLAGWSYAVGDVVLGTNPVSSDPRSVAAVEAVLWDILVDFGLQDTLPHCVLAHIEVQAAVERAAPGTTGIWFQSIAGSDAANATFGLDLEGLRRHARGRTGRWGLYFETGQGADFTNGHGRGVDMVVHEARKYGLARLLRADVADARRRLGLYPEPWVHVNDVAGFIGPEVFRTRDQLVRCCLEDIAMAKLHGLMIGLDVCATLHMDIGLDDLDWCLERIAPACPGYLMALPTKSDPMLGYLTTAFQDHVRLRERFGTRVDDRMWEFFRDRLGVVDARGRPTARFGDPVWVHLQLCRARGDVRPDDVIAGEGRAALAAVRARGVAIGEGHGDRPWDLPPALDAEVRGLCDDAKHSLRAEWRAEFVSKIPGARRLATCAGDRDEYILHPPTGEALSPAALTELHVLKDSYAGRFDTVLVVSDGLNARALMDDEHLFPFLDVLVPELRAAGFAPAPDVFVLAGGRVRAGYALGAALFADLPGPRRLVHVIGERPGTMHHAFSVYLSAADGLAWARPRGVDHHLTRVISGVADTAYLPARAAREAVAILQDMPSRTCP
ncbi:ethanolamine ammonia-lyase subunit EutB [Nannocystis bainbridge]|uniref:Ethanolamine ammonia-lyase subunit EutB n=1 Tax=Nannocystis bainbridge TaxID=2995303 RepID=A0ABT5DQZ6_9BACT|nr:ethanolamine ammonia-lyase subunit EutB [Nannocystis bainbridge]MDC0716055.1 ethanolamine ammonia-lyase subunit EutB [Nannocystis bainbridge]